MAYLSESLRQQVSERAQGRCEYCQTQQVIVVSMVIDHIVPESAGGSSDLDNLCLACISCNAFKQDFQTGIDPETQTEWRLFNPRYDVWHNHFHWSDDGIMLVGLSPEGRATILRLKMNRLAVCESRRLWVTVGWHPPK
ncbi:MAG: HNH endonuclease [Phototrophicaceae bacterium]